MNGEYILTKEMEKYMGHSSSGVKWLLYQKREVSQLRKSLKVGSSRYKGKIKALTWEGILEIRPISFKSFKFDTFDSKPSHKLLIHTGCKSGILTMTYMESSYRSMAVPRCHHNRTLTFIFCFMQGEGGWENYVNKIFPSLQNGREIFKYI